MESEEQSLRLSAAASVSSFTWNLNQSNKKTVKKNRVDLSKKSYVNQNRLQSSCCVPNQSALFFPSLHLTGWTTALTWTWREQQLPCWLFLAHLICVPCWMSDMMNAVSCWQYLPKNVQFPGFSLHLWIRFLIQKKT